VVAYFQSEKLEYNNFSPWLSVPEGSRGLQDQTPLGQRTDWMSQV